MKRFKFFVFLVLSIVIIIFINSEVIFLPLFEVNAPDSIATKVKDEISKSSFMGLTFKWKIKNNKIEEKIRNIERVSLKKKGFLKWEIDIVQEVCNYIIKLNGYPLSIDKEGFLINENINNDTNNNSLSVFIVNVKSKNDAKVIYNDHVRPFLLYINLAKSKFYPMISEINFDDTFGLSFMSYDKKRIIIGYRKDYNVIEDIFFKVKNLLKEKNEYNNYSELDFRFKNRVICRKK